MSSQPDPKNLFRILVASDIHIGYGEKKGIIAEDSFNTFEEVLSIAKDEKVDLVLLGGDLFHDNKPSQKCMLRCTELLRKYCFGDDEVSFKLVSDQNENFRHTKLFPHVNYEDCNLNVSMPVFTIHGNHDDPTGKNPRCYLEVMSASGLINYFGKYMDMEGIDLSPLLLEKGKTKLALYGLGSLPEERLHRFFKDNKMNFLRPEENTEEWFNLFVVHQNRVAHGTKYLPEHFLSNLPNLVIWGHEHEAITEPQYNTEQGFYVYQPGSTVMTSLCAGEAKPKHVAVLEIVRNLDGDGENNFQIRPVPLVTPRPFVFDSVNLDEVFAESKRYNAETAMAWCESRVEEMISEAAINHSGDPRQPKLPLIRLRLESTKTLPFSIFLFSTKFRNRVANPEDIILFKLKRIHRSGTKVAMDSEKLNELIEDRVSNIEDIVEEYFQEAGDKAKLSLINERGLTIAVKQMVDKEETDAIQGILEEMLTDCRDALMNDLDVDIMDREAIVASIKAHRQRLVDKEKKERVDVKAAIFGGNSGGGDDESNSKTRSQPLTSIADDSPPSSPAPTPQKSKKSAAKAKPKKPFVKKTTKNPRCSEDDYDSQAPTSSESDSDVVMESPVKAPTRRGRPSKRKS